MVMVTYFKKIADLLFCRVMLLFLVFTLLLTVLIKHDTLKVKALNYFIPSETDLRDFVFHPELMSTERIKDVLVYYDAGCQFLSRDPEVPAPCGTAAYAYYYLGKKEKAVNYYLNAIKRCPGFFWFYFNLGVIYYNDEQYKKAMDYFALALSVSQEQSLRFLLVTKTYRDLSKMLGLFPQDFGHGLEEGLEHAKKLYLISRLLAENKDFRAQVERKKINLRIF